MSLLEVNQLSFQWSADEPPLFSISSLKLDAGQSAFLQGKSGIGKSTLLSLLAGMQVPSAGSIKFNGQIMNKLSGPARDQLRRHKIGVIFQQFNLLPFLSVQENIALPVQNQNSFEIRSKITKLTESLGLSSSLLNRKASQLSIGQQQRVAAARALIIDPSLIIADEPTSSLDDDSADRFLEVLTQQSRDLNSAIIFASHQKRFSSHFDLCWQMEDWQ